MLTRCLQLCDSNSANYSSVAWLVGAIKMMIDDEMDAFKYNQVYEIIIQTIGPCYAHFITSCDVVVATPIHFTIIYESISATAAY